METPKIFEKEYQFCLFLQENEPIRSGELAKLSAEKLGWKTTTTYTVIKRLSERGVVRNKKPDHDLAGVPGRRAGRRDRCLRDGKIRRFSVGIFSSLPEATKALAGYTGQAASHDR